MTDYNNNCFNYALINRKQIVNLNDGTIYNFDEAKKKGLKRKDVLIPKMRTNKQQVLNRTFFLKLSDFLKIKIGEKSTIIVFCEKVLSVKRNKFATFSMLDGAFEIKIKGSIKKGSLWSYLDMYFIPFNSYAIYCERVNNENGFKIHKHKEIPPNTRPEDFFNDDMMCIY